jgi:DNA excision repair protein ERCC-4
MNQPIEKKVSLKIDFREQRSGIVGEIEKLTDQITYEMGTLSTGDYIIGNKIIVERKTLGDFLSSIKSGRIFQQAYHLAQSGKNPLIILEGDKSLVKSGSMSRKAVQGVLIHLTVFTGIPVVRSLNIQETAQLLADILRQCQQQELPALKQIITRCPGIRINKKQKQKLLFFLNLKGIGTKKAFALFKFFSTIENILNALPDDLTKVRGIGNKLADRIFTVLHEPF